MINHPFSLTLENLEDLDLNFEEVIDLKSPDAIHGGILPGGCVITRGWGEMGGYCPPPPICIKPPICPIPIDPPICEPPSIPKCPPEVTTLALGEEGGGCLIY
ncbi:MAG: hypothetical protein B0A82_18120 [Alkalinema sp. CACIAM 70d]|nr:MAG: hypothetical protein B0A82_18120 [Alkalinema sp. CACIAM 70d]